MHFFSTRQQSIRDASQRRNRVNKSRRRKNECKQCINNRALDDNLTYLDNRVAAINDHGVTSDPTRIVAGQKDGDARDVFDVAHAAEGVSGINGRLCGAGVLMVERHGRVDNYGTLSLVEIGRGCEECVWKSQVDE